MFIVYVHIRIKAEFIEQFKRATMENARHSTKETGVIRFEVVQQKDDLTRFVLVEIYRDEGDLDKHKESTHYQKWRDTVAQMMEEPRSSIRYKGVYPKKVLS